MVQLSELSLFGKTKWVYLFEVKDELDLQTNEPIPWSGATVNEEKTPDETGAKIVTINPSSEFGKLPIRKANGDNTP